MCFNPHKAISILKYTLLLLFEEEIWNLLEAFSTFQSYTKQISSFKKLGFVCACLRNANNSFCSILQGTDFLWKSRVLSSEK